LADHLAARWHLGAFRRASDAREARGKVQDHDVRLVKPWTFMNRSGAALAPLRSLAGFEAATDLLVLVDDYATALGGFRLRGAGGTGGHNGLKSIEGALRRQDYARLRIGIGPLPNDVMDPADFVLGPLDRTEQSAIKELLDPMAEAVETWLDQGIEKAMTKHNKKP
jgi:PTH1 family peptidyl-tRNA hydrolase